MEGERRDGVVVLGCGGSCRKEEGEALWTTGGPSLPCSGVMMRWKRGEVVTWCDCWVVPAICHVSTLHVVMTYFNHLVLLLVFILIVAATTTIIVILIHTLIALQHLRNGACIELSF